MLLRAYKGQHETSQKELTSSVRIERKKFPGVEKVKWLGNAHLLNFKEKLGQQSSPAFTISLIIEMYYINVIHLILKCFIFMLINPHSLLKN